MAFALTNNNMISGWDTSPVTEMQQLFAYMGYNRPFTMDFDISNWDVSNVTGMTSMFTYCEDWNNGGSPGISGWDTSSVTRMSSMFQNTAFNQDVGAWDVSNVDYINGMFSMSPFNNGGSSSISGWDTSSVVYLNGMFSNNLGFNQPIGTWDTSKVQFMNMVFNDSNYGYDLAGWVVTGVTSANSFLGSSSKGMSTSNYSATLIGWGAQSVQNGVNIGFGNSRYSAGAAASARQSLVNQGWTITDGGQA